MRSLSTIIIFLIYILISGSLSEENGCPAGCFCDKKKGENLEGLRVRCVELENGKFNPTLLPNNTVQLDLNGYGLRGIGANFFNNVKHLEKIDISNNLIEYLDEDAFRHLGNLKTLDISNNKLSVLTMDTLYGLSSLERLKLNNNNIKTIEFGAFSHLTNIQKIDLADNPLICDCNIAWMLGQTHWLDIAGAKSRCGSPQHLENILLRKLKVSNLTCDVPMLPTLNHKASNSIIDMKIIPSKPQVVFQGDSLRLQCHVGLVTNDLLVRWFHNDKLLDHSSVTSITNLGPSKHQPRPGHTSQLYISRLGEEDSGNWTCSALVDTGMVRNISLQVVVISSGVILCPATTTNTTKGVYRWGVTVAGHVASQPCHNVSRASDHPPAEAAMVEYSCHQSGRWAVLNDSACGHTSDVTDKLYRFAYMNNSDFDQNTLIQSARKLLEFTSVATKFQDGMDLVFLSTVLENYLPYLTTSHELASLLVDIAANTMRMSPDVMYQGQLLGHAASRLIATIANISRIVPAFQLHRSSLAVESFKIVSPDSFAGITCSWFTASEAGDTRRFHCSENNVTVTSPGSTILASVQLPSTLYYQLRLLGRDVNIAKNIMFSTFTNSSLFPQIITSSTNNKYKVISSCVIGSSILNAEPFNLSEPVYIILKLDPHHSYVSTTNVRPGWWDSRANNGLGAWQTQYCKVMKSRRDSSVFSCNRLGYYALLADTGDNSVMMTNLVDGAGGLVFSGYNIVHTTVYISTLISIVILCATVCMFTYLYSKIRITKKLKHALPNFWMSLIFLLVFYALSISVQSAPHLCQSVGVLLHYFILTSCLWLTVISSIVYRKLINPTDSASEHGTNPYVVTPQEEVYIGGGGGGAKRYKKPLGQYYLIGWGVPLIICGITAGASLTQYTDTGYHWCFLSLAPAIGAILIPVVLISCIHLFFIFAIFSFSTRPGGTETKLVTSDMGSSRSTLLVTDSHHSHTSHTRVLLLVSVMLLSVFVFAILSITAPVSVTIMTTASQNTVFSVLYSVMISTLSLTILTYYCLARQDVVHCKLPLGWGYTVQDETSNLVDLTVQKSVPNNSNNYMLDTSKTGYPMVELGGSVLGPSTGGRLKQCNLDRDSEDDYHSVNNSQHLSRPRPGGVSQSETETINKSMTDIMFGPSAKVKVNNVNIHMGDTSMHKTPWMDVRSDWSVTSQQCYFPPPAPVMNSPMELPYPDMSAMMLPDYHQSASVSVSASLPRRRPERKDKRRKPGLGVMAYSDIERTEIYSSSRISEISTSTAASTRSRASKTR